MIKALENKRILVVVAHPDDELLGCGATMHKLIRHHQCTIRAVILGEGLTSRSDERNTEQWKSELQKHKENIESAASHIGYESVKTYDFPDNRFDSVDLLDIVKKVEAEKVEFEPDIIFTHHGGDLNIDHQRTFEAVVTSTRPLPDEGVSAVITFETPSGTEWQASSDPRKFEPNMFVEIAEEDLQAKIKGMESYEFEKRQYPHPRSPEALKILAQRYGIMQGGGLFEAFQIIRLRMN